MQGQRRDYKTARGEGRGARISVGGGKLSLLAGVVMAVMLLAACQAVTPARPSAEQAPATLVLATHDSFAIGEEVLAAFEAQHNVQVQVWTLGDGGRGAQQDHPQQRCALGRSLFLASIRRL